MFIMIVMADSLGCGFVLWSVAECAKSERLKLNCPRNRDPNFVTDDEAATTPFNLCIKDHVLRCKEVNIQ
jgi:phage FluMu protein Com